MTISTPMLPGLSPVGGKKVVAQFDGGLLSSDAGVLALREIEQRLCVAERLAACIVDPRTPEQIVHSPADISAPHRRSGCDNLWTNRVIAKLPTA